MLHTRRRFQVPATGESRDPVQCWALGFHLGSGPAKRRTCLHCGKALPKECPERVALEQDELPPGIADVLSSVEQPPTE